MTRSASRRARLWSRAATTAETEILVRDTETEQSYRIFNPRDVLFEAVADTEAFRTRGF